MARPTSRPPNSPFVPPPWQPRFGMRGMLLLMVVVSVMGAGAYYFAQSLRGGRSFQLAFVLFTLAAPLLVMVVISVFRALVDRNPRNRRR